MKQPMELLSKIQKAKLKQLQNKKEQGQELTVKEEALLDMLLDLQLAEEQANLHNKNDIERKTN